jgi:N-acetylglucosaminyl-diphospho-decaprenol L-rhamnosyltransferase
MNSRPDISIIIVTYNSRPFIRECLRAIESDAGGISLETIVIDNHSADRSAEVASHFPWVRVIRRRRNEGFASAVNLGLSFTDSEYALLLNPDAIVTKGAIRSMKDYMESNPDVACVSPQLLNFDGTVQRSCREFPGVKTIVGELLLAPWFGRVFPGFDRYRMSYFDHSSTRDVDQPMASCLIFRRSIFDEVGNLDESMPIFFNDVDLCRRIREHGGRIVFYPSAKVYHYSGASTRQMGAAKELHLARSMYRYMRKHSRGLTAYTSGLLLIVGFLLKTGRTAAMRILKG